MSRSRRRWLLYLALTALAVGGGLALWPSTPPPSLEAAYRQIWEGMPRPEVERIVGRPCDLGPENSVQSRPALVWFEGDFRLWVDLDAYGAVTRKELQRIRPPAWITKLRDWLGLNKVVS